MGVGLQRSCGARIWSNRSNDGAAELKPSRKGDVTANPRHFRRW